MPPPLAFRISAASSVSRQDSLPHRTPTNAFRRATTNHDATTGRGAVHALKLLDGYRGVVQCDGYAAYKTIADKAPGEAITLAFC
jgi:hypothetical protein